MKAKTKGKLADGVILMTLSGVAVKAAGLLFKIPLTSLIGEEGMGYFNSAYTIFTWVYMISCAGLPTAASMMIAAIPEGRREDGARRIFAVSLAVFATLGAFFAAMLFLFAKPLAALMRVEDAALAISAVAPTLIFVTQSAALRGYFQGLGDLRPHSVSQLLEAVGKLMLGVMLAYIAAKRGKSIPEAAAYAAFGVTAGVFIGTAALYLAFFIRRRRSGDVFTAPKGSVPRRLIKAALPITLSSSVMSLANLIDSFIMTRSLHASGMSQAECAAVWGNYSSLAVPMFNLPPVLTMPIAYALLPALTSALSVGSVEKARELTRDALSKTAFLAVPCAVGLCAMSKPILSLLFDAKVAERGAFMLTLLAPSSMLLCLLSLFNTILQASGHERLPLAAMLSGAAVKLCATRLLTPEIGKYATPVSTFLCYFTACIIAAAFIGAKTPLAPSFGIGAYTKPLVIAAASVGVAVLAYPFIGTLAAIALAAVVYFAVFAATRPRS